MKKSVKKTIAAILVLHTLLTKPATSQQTPVYNDCHPSVYYAPVVDANNNATTITNNNNITTPSATTRNDMHQLIQSTHRTSLPYTSYSTNQKDVWDALVAMDSDESGENVWLIYGDKWVPASPRDDGSCGSWNREHLWPRSRGVGEDGYDNTDLHHLRPADCNVNAARSNRLFASCGTASPSSTCTNPAHSEAALDTERDSLTFLPPVNSRGDIARAILYMDLRYDGDESNPASRDTLDLIVSDCPDPEFGMGYLSQLLEWHMMDPPDERERMRNDQVCEYWQGNRNPFVDFPELASAYYGSPRSLIGNGLGYECSTTPTTPVTSPPIKLPTVAPSTQGSTNNNQGTCLGMAPGDVTIVGMQSVDPDMIVLLALADLPPRAELFITDNAWTGYELKSNEGTKKLTIPSNGIPGGTMFGYDSASESLLFLGGSWSPEGGNLALSVSGDNVMLYCVDGGGVVNFLYAGIYQRGWSSENSDSGAFSSNESALPATLPSNCAVSLPTKKRNFWYHGTYSGTKDELLNSIADDSNWTGDDVVFDVNMVTPSPSTQPSAALEPGTCGGMKQGDVAIVGIKSMDPDMVEMLAVAHLPAGASIYITDNAWTGYELKSNEGVRKLDIPSRITKGTIFGYDASSETFLNLGNAWTKEGGSFSLSTSGDNVMVYCIDSNASKQFLFAATYQSDWSAENADPSAFSTNESARPSDLPPNAAVTLLTKKKNFWYHGSYDGSKSELLDSISIESNWTADDNSS